MVEEKSTKPEMQANESEKMEESVPKGDDKKDLVESKGNGSKEEETQKENDEIEIISSEPECKQIKEDKEEKEVKNASSEPVCKEEVKKENKEEKMIVSIELECKQQEIEKKNDEVKESTDSKNAMEVTVPKKVDKKKLSKPSCSKKVSEPAGKHKRVVIDPKKKVTRKITEWEATHMHLELQGEKGRLKPYEVKNLKKVTYILRKTDIVIGRDDDCDIKFKDTKGMGEKHCKINFTADGKAYLHPLYTSGLTYLNGEMLRSRKLLSHNDVITIVKFSYRFIYPESSKYNPTAKPSGSKKVKEKEEEKSQTEEKQNVEGNQSKENDSEKISTESKITPKQAAERTDIEEKAPVSDKVNDLLSRYLDSEYSEDDSSDSDYFDDIEIPAAALGQDPRVEALDRLLDEEIMKTLQAQNSQNTGESSQQVKKMKIYKKSDSSESDSRVRNELINAMDRYNINDDNDEDDENEGEEEVVADAQTFRTTAYFHLLKSLKTYHQNKQSLTRINVLLQCLDTLHKMWEKDIQNNYPPRCRRTKEENEMIAETRKGQRSVMRMYQKFSKDKEELEKEPFGEMGPAQLLQYLQQFQRQLPRRKLVARRKGCDQNV